MGKMTVMTRRMISGAAAAVLLMVLAAFLILKQSDFSSYLRHTVWGSTHSVSEDIHTPPRHAGSFRLEIFGNANGDGYIDQDDIAFLKRIIANEEEETVLADANRDGVIDEKDIELVEQIIAGTADFIWILDGNGEPVKVNLPVRKIGVEYLSNAELMNVLGVPERVAAVDAAAYLMKDFYFPGRKLQNMGQMHQNPDFERIIGMNLDVLFTFSPVDNDTKQEKLPDTDVVFLGLYWPDVLEPQNSKFLQGILKAGYILGTVDRAYDYKEWLLDITHRIGSVTSTLSDDDKPGVLMTSFNRYFEDPRDFSAAVYTRIDPLSQACILAGGKPVAEDLDNWIGKGRTYGTVVDLEWIVERDPEFIFAHSVRTAYDGRTREPDHGYDCNDPAPFNNAVKEMKSRSLLAGLSAIANNNIYITAGDFRNNAMGGILGAVYLAGILHPDLFPELDPRAVHQAFVSRWMGLDYDLKTNGVFIAPALTQAED